MAIFANGLGGGIGRRLARRLGNFSVTRLSASGVPGSVFCDLRKGTCGVEGRFSRGDTFLFLAAMSKPGDCARNPEEAWRINVAHTAALIGAALDAGARVIFFSSDTVYGAQEGSLSESAPLQAVEPYGAMKARVEREFAGTPGFTALRLSYVVSLEDGVTRYLRECARAGAKAEVFSRYARSMVWVEDVTAAVATLLRLSDRGDELPGAVNLGGMECLTRTRMAAAFQEAIAPGLEICEVEPPEGFFAARPERIELDVSLLAALLGRNPLSLREAYAREMTDKGK